MALAAASSGRSDIELVRPFIQATLETIRVQCQLDVTHQDPFFKGHGTDLKRDFAAVFSVFSRGANVAVCLGFERTVYTAVLTKMLGPEGGKHLQDGLKELVNIIFSKVRKLANTDGRVLNRGVPAIVEGENIQVTYLSTTPVVVVPFQTEVGPFQLELILET